MRRSLVLTLLLIAGLMVFSLVSCGGSNDRKAASTQKEGMDQYAKADSSDSYDDNMYAAYEKEDAPAMTSSFKPFPIYTDGRSPDNHYIASGYMGNGILARFIHGINSSSILNHKRSKTHFSIL